MIKNLLWLSLALMATPVYADQVAATSSKDLFAQPCTTAQAQSVLRAAMPDLDEVQVLRGQFTQRKILREIPGALVSTGDFLLVRDRGVWWHTLTPLDSELTLRTPGLSGPEAGASSIAASMFLALFALDLETLSRNFDLFVLGPAATEKQWQLGLRPRDAALAAWFGHAVIRGGERVQQVILFEAAGDRTEIDLTAKSHPQSSLTTTERQRFEP